MSIEDENKGEIVIPTVSLEEELKQSYLDYAMSVIVSRALPDVRDGLKPVHRRILYGMREVGCDYNKPFKKSARIVGDVMGKYHPHGDAAIYDSMVRMAQDFSMRDTLVDGQGNFGSIDGDSAAAMRYTEARLSKLASTMLDDIDKDTVEFQPNYDESLSEPALLPAKFPNILVNGSGGIAVGMATNIPSHNLADTIDACIAYIDNPSITIEELIGIVKGPDFPTGGTILGRGGIVSSYKTGRGSIIIRSKSHIEELKKDRQAIVITEIPYQVNKSKLIERIAEIVNDKTIEGVSDLRDESNREGIRIVIELKKDVIPDVILNQLYKYTQVQTSFGVNMLALINGRPKLMNLQDIIGYFVTFRKDVVVRRTRFELRKSRNQAHVLIGLAVAVTNIDRVINLIKSSSDTASAKRNLMEERWHVEDVEALIRLVDDGGNIVENGTCRLTEVQAQAILDLKLQRLTGLERDKIAEELGALTDKIRDLLNTLGSKERIFSIVKDELIAVKNEFGTARRTDITDADGDIDIEDLIQKEPMVVTVSNTGYIKRVPLASFRTQKRGGKGKTGMTTKEEDFVHDLFVADTHTPVLFFSTNGIAYEMKVYKLPLATPQAKGRALVNLLPIEAGESVATVLPLPGDKSLWEDLDVVFATSHGTIRRNKLSDFLNIRASGKIAMKLDEGEKLIAVEACNADSDILISTKMGKCVKFSVEHLRVFASRASTGVRAIKLLGDDEVISMAILKQSNRSPEDRDSYIRYVNSIRRNKDELDIDIETNVEKPDFYEEMKANDQLLLTVTEKGYGKRTSVYEYRTTSRGAQGVKNIEMNSKNGKVVAVFPVQDEDEVMLVTNNGKLIRCPVDGIRITSRAAQGVIIFRLEKGEKVVSAVRLHDPELDSVVETVNVGKETKVD